MRNEISGWIEVKEYTYDARPSAKWSVHSRVIDVPLDSLWVNPPFWIKLVNIVAPECWVCLSEDGDIVHHSTGRHVKRSGIGRREGRVGRRENTWLRSSFAGVHWDWWV